MGFGFVWVAILFLIIALFYRIIKDEDWGMSFTMAFAILGSFVWLWLPLSEFIPEPGTFKEVYYSAPETKKPTPPMAFEWNEEKDIVVTVKEAISGRKTVYKSLILGMKHEKILSEAQPAVYEIRKVKNPNYKPPGTIYTPPIQRQFQCPITTCCDGTCSQSTGRGTCSWHGGVCG